ncbi:MAG: hypothetical protein KC910_29385 [Candidatus Eremiobacteraeota bacterium]|nr:hypothetical protein [Candidatus Eremiobacteraeota bacterium]
MRNWLVLLLLVATPALARQNSFELDAPNGAVQSSTELTRLADGQVFNLYITPLDQHLGDSLYSTEIQVHFGPVGIAFSRLDPRIINKDIDDPDKLPPIWETRRLTGHGATSIEDPRIVALGSAGISLEDDQPFLLQARRSKGLLYLYHRATADHKAHLLAKFQVAGAALPVSVKVIGYQVRFTLP